MRGGLETIRVYKNEANLKPRYEDHRKDITVSKAK